MRRSRPLETIRVEVAPGQFVAAPTAEESLRVKAYLVVQRNQVRDYIDVVALSEHIGRDSAVAVLRRIDEYYDDRSMHSGSVLTSLALSLAAPSPRDVDVIDELPRYRALDPRRHDWSDVVAACEDLALRLADLSLSHFAVSTLRVQTLSRPGRTRPSSRPSNADSSVIGRRSPTNCELSRGGSWPARSSGGQSNAQR